MYWENSGEQKFINTEKMVAFPIEESHDCAWVPEYKLSLERDCLPSTDTISNDACLNFFVSLPINKEETI